MKKVIPPTPEQHIYMCDRCKKGDLKLDHIDATMKVTLRDFQGGAVAGNEYHLCRGCTAEVLLEWGQRA